MNEKEFRNKIQKVIKEIFEEELEENLLHVTPSNQETVMAIDNKIENIFPGYSEETKEFIPQKVVDKQY